MKGLLTWRGHAWLALPLRWYLGVVFLMACAHKILHPASFALDVDTYDILPLALIKPLKRIIVAMRTKSMEFFFIDSLIPRLCLMMFLLLSGSG